MKVYTRRSRRPGKGSAATSAQKQTQHSGVAAWKRRHAAKRRLLQLDCGCRDPWPCRCSKPPLTERQIDAGRAAARHLLACGKVPLLEFEILQALWRRGGTDRQLAEQLFELTGGAVA